MIPLLLDNTKKLTDLLTDDTCVLRLQDAISCEVEEEVNGAYTAKLELPLTDAHVNTINAGVIIKLKANPYDGLQLFRVATVTKSMTKITAELKHITYDLSKTSVLPLKANTVAEAMQQIMEHMKGGEEFTLSTNKTTKAQFSNKLPQSARALLGGQEGSLLDVYGGYYYWDNLTVTLGDRGTDNGVTIRYGKNLVSAEQEESIEDMYTAVQPYVVINDQTITGTYKELIANAYPVRVYNLDLSDTFNALDTTGTDESLPTVEDIDKACETFVNANKMTEPKVSLTVSYEDLRKYGEQYKEEVRLCDTVHVFFEKLGIKASAKVAKYTYDTLTEKYKSVEIGSVKSKLSNSISSLISSSADKVAQATNIFLTAQNEFSNLLISGLGLFKTVETQTDGSAKIYLHNRPAMADSDVWYTMNANGFALSRDKGQTWIAGIDKDGNAVFNVLAANTIKALNIYGALIQGSQIIFGDDTTKKVTATSYESGVKFEGNGKILFRTADSYRFFNYFDDTYQRVCNSFVGTKTDKSSRSCIFNYDPQTGNTGNIFDLSTDDGAGTTRLSNHRDGVMANQLQMYSKQSTGASGLTIGNTNIDGDKEGKGLTFRNYLTMNRSKDGSSSSIGMYNCDAFGKIVANVNINNGEVQIGYGDQCYIHINKDGYMYLKIAGVGAYKIGWIVKDGVRYLGAVL